MCELFSQYLNKYKCHKCFSLNCIKYQNHLNNDLSTSGSLLKSVSLQRFFSQTESIYDLSSFLLWIFTLFSSTSTILKCFIHCHDYFIKSNIFPACFHFPLRHFLISYMLRIHTLMPLILKLIQIFAFFLGSRGRFGSFIGSSEVRSVFTRW